MRRAAGAVSGQLSQALASFVLQVLAARALGAEGLGRFAMLYGAIIVATAVSTGMVGDSLTVLQRERRPIRAALVRWCLLVSGAAGIVCAVVAAAAGALSVGGAVLFALATASFLIEDVLRRMLMATMRFWSLPLVDCTSLIGSVITLGAVRLSGGHLTLSSFMVALLVGQVLATFLAALRLPAEERSFPLAGSAAMREVFHYGAWRSVQLSLRPGTLTAARVVITVIVGLRAYGELEAARVYMAPALLLVSGMGSFLLPTYVAQRDHDFRRVRRGADKAATALLVATLVGGVIGTLAAPLIGPLLTGGKYDLAPVAVFGWAVYAASSASALPYTALAAVRGHQRTVTIIRLADPVLSLLLVAAAAAVAVDAAPYALAVGTFLAGLIVRFVILRPGGERPGTQPAEVDPNAETLELPLSRGSAMP